MASVRTYTESESCFKLRAYMRWVCDLYILAGDAGGSAPSGVRLCGLGPCWKLNYLFFIEAWWSHLKKKHRIILLFR